MTIVYDFGCRFSELISTKINRIFGACVLRYAAKVSYITDIVLIALYFQLDIGHAVAKILLGVLRDVLCFYL
jgi:hypothetical protein